MQARGFQKHMCAVCIDREIRERFACGPVVARLRGGVDDNLNVGAISLKNAKDAFLIANIDSVMRETFQIGLQFPCFPCSGGLNAKEVGAQIIIDADYLETLFVKKFCSFASDQTGRTRD